VHETVKNLRKFFKQSPKSAHKAQQADAESRRGQQQRRHANSAAQPELPPFGKDTIWLYIDTALQTFKGLVIAGIVGLVILGSLGLGLGMGYLHPSSTILTSPPGLLSGATLRTPIIRRQCTMRITSS
jgi:hypothetical protein